MKNVIFLRKLLSELLFYVFNLSYDIINMSSSMNINVKKSNCKI